MKNKFLSVAFGLFLSFPMLAQADSNSQAISDGTTVNTIKTALVKELAVTNVQIKSYAKSWNSYNPMSWVIDSGGKYRTIEISFVDKSGKKQEMSCSLKIDSGDTSVTVYGCTGGDKAIGLYSRLASYGYAAESIVLNSVISKPASGSTANPTTGVQ